jgi:hypothetical protein
MTAARTMLCIAAVNALGAAAALAETDPDFAPLPGAQVFVGQTWPSQSPTPGAAPMPNQLLVYGWEEDSDSLSGESTSPQFKTTTMLVVEARVETRSPAAQATLPSVPSSDAIAATVDARLAALTYAVKNALLCGLATQATAVNGGQPLVQGFGKLQSKAMLDGEGQRIAGNDAVTIDVIYGETFNFATVTATPALTEVSTTIGAQAVAKANNGNQGNGTISAVAVGGGVQVGTYAVAFTSATSFTVTNPDSTSAGAGTVGTQFAGGGLTFTITVGSQAYVAGDGYGIAVWAAAETQLNLSE